MDRTPASECELICELGGGDGEGGAGRTHVLVEPSAEPSLPRTPRREVRRASGMGISTMNIRQQLELRLRAGAANNMYSKSGRPAQRPLELRGRLPPSGVLLRLPVAQVLLQPR
jgi:hypothetical protein